MRSISKDTMYNLYHIYTFARVARWMTSVPITYSPRHSLCLSPRHSWRLLWKRFFKHESKGTNGDSRYVYEHYVRYVYEHYVRYVYEHYVRYVYEHYVCYVYEHYVCTHVKTSFFAQRQRHTNVCASGEARARVCKCEHECVNVVLNLHCLWAIMADYPKHKYH